MSRQRKSQDSLQCAEGDEFSCSDSGSNMRQDMAPNKKLLLCDATTAYENNNPMENPLYSSEERFRACSRRRSIRDAILCSEREILNRKQADAITTLLFLQDKHDSPSEEDIKKVTVFSLGNSEEDCMERFQHGVEIVILVVEQKVEFAKGVPYFDTVSPEEQVTLLKECFVEVLLLWAARKYDEKTDSIVFGENYYYTKENIRSVGMGHFSEVIFDFCRRMRTLDVNDAEYALLTAITIFSKRRFLIEPKKVITLREFYIGTLRAYIANSRPQLERHFDKLLDSLIELSRLGNRNSQQWLSMKVDYKKLPPLLEERFNTQQQGTNGGNR